MKYQLSPSYSCERNIVNRFNLNCGYSERDCVLTQSYGYGY